MNIVPTLFIWMATDAARVAFDMEFANKEGVSPLQIAGGLVRAAGDVWDERFSLAFAFITHPDYEGHIGVVSMGERVGDSAIIFCDLVPLADTIALNSQPASQRAQERWSLLHSASVQSRRP